MSVLTQFFGDRIPTQISSSKKEVLFAQLLCLRLRVDMEGLSGSKKEELISSWLSNSSLCVGFFLSGRLLVGDQKDVSHHLSQQQQVFIILTARISTKWEYLFPKRQSSKGAGENTNWLCLDHMTIPDPITLLQENKPHSLIRPEMCVHPRG